MDDILTYALYPTTGLRFLRIKHGLEPVPDEMKPATNVGPVQAKAPAPKGPGARKSPRTRAFDVYVEGEKYRVEVDPLDALSRSQDGAVVVERPPSGSDTPSKDAIQPQTAVRGTSRHDHTGPDARACPKICCRGRPACRGRRYVGSPRSDEDGRTRCLHRPRATSRHSHSRPAQQSPRVTCSR